MIWTHCESRITTSVYRNDILILRIIAAVYSDGSQLHWHACGRLCSHFHTQRLRIQEPATGLSLADSLLPVCFHYPGAVFSFISFKKKCSVTQNANSPGAREHGPRHVLTKWRSLHNELLLQGLLTQSSMSCSHRNPTKPGLHRQ